MHCAAPTDAGLCVSCGWDSAVTCRNLPNEFGPRPSAIGYVAKGLVAAFRRNDTSLRQMLDDIAAERTHPENGHGRETKSGGHCVRQIDYAQLGDPPVDTGLENLQILPLL
jgi:hypothetical protein